MKSTGGIPGWKILGSLFIAGAIRIMFEIFVEDNTKDFAVKILSAVCCAVIGLLLILKRSRPKDEDEDGHAAKKLEPYQILRIVLRIFGVLFLYTAVLCTVVLALDGTGFSASDAAILILCVAVGLFLLFKKVKTPEERAKIKAEKVRQKEIDSRSFAGEHVGGLPIARGITCVFRFEDDHLAINGSGNDFMLAYSKVTEMQIMSDVEIRKHYVSDAGGAAAGNAALGPLGAMLFGGVEERTERTVREYIVITYIDSDRIKYITFEIFDRKKIARQIERFRPRFSGQSVAVEL